MVLLKSNLLVLKLMEYLNQKNKPKITFHQPQRLSKLFVVQKMDICFDNGTTQEYERIISTNGAVMVIPFDGMHFYLTIEFCGGIGDYTLGLCKGKIDDNESSYDAAMREMQEEVGYRAGKLTLLKQGMTVAPGMLELKMDVYLAEDLEKSKLIGDEPEEIEIVKLTPSEVFELIFKDNSPLAEGRVIAALILALHKVGYF